MPPGRSKSPLSPRFAPAGSACSAILTQNPPFRPPSTPTVFSVGDNHACFSPDPDCASALATTSHLQAPPADSYHPEGDTTTWISRYQLLRLNVSPLLCPNTCPLGCSIGADSAAALLLHHRQNHRRRFSVKSRPPASSAIPRLQNCLAELGFWYCAKHSPPCTYQQPL